MTDPLDDALREFRKGLSELRELSHDLTARKFGFSARSLPRLPPAGPGPVDVAATVLRPTLAPSEVAKGWNGGGVAWLRSIGRRDLSAACAALGDPRVGPFLAADPKFASALLPLLRARQQLAVVARLYFQQFPVAEHVMVVLLALQKVVSKEDWPAWWRIAVAGPDALAGRMAGRVLQSGWATVAAELELPEAAAGPVWAKTVSDRCRPDSVESARHLLHFADGGRDLSSPTPLSEGTIAAIRCVVAFGDRVASARFQVAKMVRVRVGDVFGPANDALWKGLEDERRRVRAWVAAEVLDILFKHLVPDTVHAHHTEPRRKFWAPYTSRIDRLWLFVERGLRSRLDRSDVRQLLERVGDVVEVRQLDGGVEQAVVWMHLRSDRGTVSVIEGNANASCRMRSGALVPPTRKVIDYRADIVNGAFDDQSPEVERQVHNGDWQSRLADKLRQRGVRP